MMTMRRRSLHSVRSSEGNRLTIFCAMDRNRNISNSLRGSSFILIRNSLSIKRFVPNRYCTLIHIQESEKSHYRHYLVTQRMEFIYDATCPADMKSETYGQVNVGNHVQYIEADTVINCNLLYWDHDNDKATPDELDTDKSYITVKDWTNDDNTFQENDYFMANEPVYKAIRKLGCREALYRVGGVMLYTLHFELKTSSVKNSIFATFSDHQSGTTG